MSRDPELERLHSWLDRALQGERQVVFVTGEPGIGKTTLVEAFLFGVRSHEEFGVQKATPQTPNSELPLTLHLWIGRGQCVEHYGVGEAYLPVLEALGRLCREGDGKEVIALLRQQAPTWLVQMPALLSTAELEELQRRTAGVTRERMLRELAEALEALTAERPLILWLEDLHWSDVSTLDWLASVARRQERARLLIVGTYRPVEVLTREHPLKGVKHELQLHGQCEELALDFLSEAAVADYLVQRFGAPSPASAGEGQGEGLSKASLQRLARLIHQRTDGNPLFMVNVVNDLIAQGVLTKTNGGWELHREVRERTLGTPVSLRQLIEHQIERVSPEAREVLEAASAAGADFSAAAVAAGVEQLPETVEAQCEALVRREQFLRTQGMSEWPDGTVAARYQFLHALYQEVFYERIPAARRSRLHRLIGERTEAAYGTQAKEIAAELAVHFEQGREYRRAIQYLQQAGENARRRSANQEAIILLTKGLELLKTLPDTSEHIQQELTLQIVLNDALVAVKGYTAPEVEKTVTRARELCQQIGETPQLFPVLWRLMVFYHNRREVQTARELVEQMMCLAQSVQDRNLLSLTHAGLGGTLFWLGELTSARPLLEQAIALYDPQKHPRATVGTADLRVDLLSYAARTLWGLGYSDQALKRSQEALALAEELAHPFSLAYALWMAAWVHLLRREEQLARERAEAVITLSTEQGFPHWLAYGTLVRGWALAEQGQVKEGIAQMRQSRAPYPLALLAEAYGKMGQVEEGLAMLAKALAQVEKTGEHVYEAELYRLRGELTLAQSRVQSLESGVQENQKPALSLVEGAKGKSRKQLSVVSSQLTVPTPQHLPPSTQAETEAEACFHKAIEIDRKQQAKSLELRAVMSLARLWKKQDKSKQAHKMLAEIYNWFTEGSDTKDLQEARALLDSLASKKWKIESP